MQLLLPGQQHPVAAGGGDEGGLVPRAALSRGRHFKEDKKMLACVQSFKCFTVVDIHPAEVFCDF